MSRLRRGHSHVRYSRPRPRDRLGRDYDAAGRLTGSEILALGVPVDADFRLCGPTPFVSAVTADLLANGAHRERIRSESFGGAPAARPTAPPVVTGDGPAIEFSRSGVTTAWDANFGNLLEVAEANAVPVASGCRIGACHGCRAAVLTGSVWHEPAPIEPPSAGSALPCCAVPETDLVLDA